MTLTIITRPVIAPAILPSVDLSEVTAYLYELLTPYLTYTPGERDELMASHGTELIRLDALLHHLTLSPDQREYMLASRQYFTTMERDIEKQRILK